MVTAAVGCSPLAVSPESLEKEGSNVSKTDWRIVLCEISTTKSNLHDSVGTVQNGVGNIGTFGTSRTGVGDHGLEHLGGGNNRLSGNVGLTDHHLLGQENLFGRDFHTKITTGNHDTVGDFEDLVIVFHTFLILNLGDDLDSLALFSQDFTNLEDVLGLTDKGSSDKVDFVDNTPVLDVVDILFSQSRQVNNNTRQVHVLAFTDRGIVFFFIGTGLFAYYETRPEEIAELKLQVAAEQLAEEVRRPLGELNASDIQLRANELKVEDLGDRVFPFFLVNVLPVGMTGLLIAALVAAAMSSIDTSLNSSATVLLTDFYQRFLRPNAGERESMIILYGATLLVGVAGTTAALAMLGIDSILDAWWSLSGMFAGGMLGLFLLGVFARSSTGRGAIVGVASGVAVIAWMTFSPVLDLPEGLKNHLHTNLTIVIGTLTIFTIGVVASRLMRRDPTR